MSLIIGIGTRIGRRVNKALKKWHTVVSQLQAMFLYRVAGDTDNDDLPESNGRAVINTIYGNTVKWNQLIRNGDFSNGTTSWEIRQSGGLTVSDGIASYYKKATSGTNTISQYCKTTQNHVYVIIADIKEFNTTAGFRFGIGSSVNLIAPSQKFDYTYSSGKYISLLKAEENYTHIGFSGIWSDLNVGDVVFKITNIQLFDLTEIFGEGNEPSTTDEFEAWLALNVGEQDYYPYDEGSLISFKGTGIKSVGFNRWDEQWENSSWSNTVGQVSTKTSSSTTLACSNPIEVKENTQYYFYFGGTIPYRRIVYLNKDFIVLSSSTSFTNRIITTPLDCNYIVFHLSNGPGGDTPSYNHDICINISDPAKNGTYEPYWSDEKPFDVTKVYGKLNGDTLIQVYPDGMFGALDETIGSDCIGRIFGSNLVALVAVRKIDLGNCLWSLVSGCNHTFETSIDIEAAEAIDYTYSETIDETDTTQDKLIGPTNGFHLTILDRSLSSTDLVDGHIAALEGVYTLINLYTGAVSYVNLVYRDNGVDTPLEQLFPFKYKVDKYSTEEVLVPTGDAPTSTSMIADIEYQAR